MRRTPNYGVDAPPWLYGSAVLGVLALGVGLWAWFAVGEGWARFLRYAVWLAAICLGYAAMHLWSSMVGKQIQARRMLDEITWRGDEVVLDVGCGHGLLLIEAAKRLSRGRAVGIDVWSSTDQWDNRPEATLENAEIAGVADRVEVREADARELPFEDASFDVALSSLVIHNISGSGEQARAVREIVRVLKPGGHVAILDIVGTRRYQRELEAAGMTAVRRRTTSPLFVPGTSTVTARKP